MHSSIRVARRAFILIYSPNPSSQVLTDVLQHLVGGGNDLGVHFVGALGGDHVHQLLDHADVGVLKGVLQDSTQAVLTGVADLRGTAGSGLQEQVATDGLQACRVDEIGGLDHAHFLHAGITEHRDRDSAVLAHGKGLHVLGQVDARLQRVAIGGNDTAVRNQVETVVTG